MISADFVEKALVGAILNHPERQGDVPWLHVEDFTHPLCRALWAHLEAHDLPTPNPLDDLPAVTELLRRVDALHPQHCAPAKVAELQVSAPEPPNVADYARILVEVAIRREVTAMGLRLESYHAGQQQVLMATTESAIARIDELRRRWRVAAATPGAGSHGHRHGLERQQLLAPGDLGDDTTAGIDATTAQLAVIGAAVHDWPPGARHHVLAEVRRSDFHQPALTATWEAIQRLVARAMAVDHVTVAWEGARTQGRKTTATGLGSRELADLRALAPLWDVGTTVLARRAAAQALATARSALRQVSGDSSIDPDYLLVMADHQHRSLADETSRSTRRASHTSPAPAVEVRQRSRNRQAVTVPTPPSSR
ncbi:MAG TPA: hypothetical protein VFJ97_04170 [Dermatophilaceae bacterium]|nr:hypothetical protein [Dermatophilaceae bacterium]